MILKFGKFKAKIANHDDKEIKIYICNPEKIPLLNQTNFENNQMFAQAFSAIYEMPTAVVIKNCDYTNLIKAFDLAFDIKTLELIPFGFCPNSQNDIVGIYFPRKETYLKYCAFSNDIFNKDINKIKLLKYTKKNITLELQ